MPTAYRVAAIALGIGAVLQLGAWGLGERNLWTRSNDLAEKFDPSAPTPRISIVDIHCLRSLPPLAAQIPEDDRVLLITKALGPGSFDFHFIPRPFRYLQTFDASWIEAAEAKRPGLGDFSRTYRDRLEADDALFNDRRLERDLAWAEWVVVLVDSPPLPPEVTLTLVAQHELATLYRVER